MSKIKIKNCGKIVMPNGLILLKHSSCADIIKYNGIYYLAFRNSPYHFPSKKTRIIVLKSKDLTNWHLNHILNMKCDLREPRFIIFKGELLLYFFNGGTKPYTFTPKNIWMVKKTGKHWTKPISVFVPGFIPWRIRIFEGKLIMSVHKLVMVSKPTIFLLSSEDGINFNRLNDISLADVKGAGETEFFMKEDGFIFGLIRIEGGGSMLFKGSMKDLSTLEFIRSPFKYDSALILEHGGNLYLISRRNLDGPADKGHRSSLGRLYNAVRYSLTRKTTAILRIDSEKFRIEHLQDIESHGDTGFPAILQGDGKKYILLNYSSPIGKHNYIWINGQIKATHIYKYYLTF